MKTPKPQGLPARIYVPIVFVVAVAFVGVVIWFLRIGIGESGTMLGPSNPLPQTSTSPGRSTR